MDLDGALPATTLGGADVTGSDAASFARVGWSRGRGCRDVAEALAGDGAFHVDRDMVSSVIARRADAIVMRRSTRFDMIPSIIPHGVDLDATDSVWAAVGGGPHSPFAVAAAGALGRRLGIPVHAATVVGPNEDRRSVSERLDELARADEGVIPIVIDGASVSALTDALGPRALLVVGAPGGSWFQRQIHGPGHRITVNAPAGVLVVRTAPRRCFQEAAEGDGTVIGVHAPVSEALRVAAHPVLAVADNGTLVGLVRCDVLGSLEPGDEVGDHMESPVSMLADEPVEAIGELAGFFDGGPVPVCAADGRLLGFVAPSAGH